MSALGALSVVLHAPSRAQEKVQSGNPNKTGVPHVRRPAPPARVAPASALLTYQFLTGATRRYHVLAFFTGHFPPFAQADGPPIRLRADLVYAAKTLSSDKNGAEVAFRVESQDISLLEEEPDAGLKIDPAKAISLALPLEDVQKTLNATALLRPDGSIVRVTSANSKAAVKINFGIDVRKLFLLLMPVSFAKQAVAVNDAWTFDDGLLGRKSNGVVYKAHLDSATEEPNRVLAYQVTQASEASVNDKIDKDGNSPRKPEDAVGSVTGKVTTQGTATYRGRARDVTAKSPLVNASLAQSRLTLNAQLVQIAPDPEHPDKMLTTNIDVQGRLLVRAEPDAH